MPQKEEGAAKKAGATAAEDAQKAIADMMVQAQAQMTAETGAVSGRAGAVLCAVASTCGLHLRWVGAWRAL